MTTATLKRHSMSVMGKEGDTKIEWDPDNKNEVKQAERTFQELTKKGYKAFRLCEEDNRGEQLDKFDKEAERIILVTPMAGG